MNLSLPPAPGLAPGIIASRIAVAMGVVMCVVALIFLTPSREQLFKRHMADGDERAASLIVAQGEGGNSDEITTALTAELIRVCERDQWAQPSLGMLCSFLGKNRNFAAASREALARIERIPGAARTQVVGALSTRALADGDLTLAQDLQTRLVEGADLLTPEIVREAVRVYRFNSNPALALLTIDTLGKQRGSLPQDLRDLQVVLAGETSQPALAFAHLCREIRATTDPATLRQLITEAVRTGIGAGRQDDLIPLYEQYLQIIRESQSTGDPLVAEYSMKLAQTYEWTKQPSKAFDVYLSLAAQGNRAALDRCLALNPGLFRQDELMEVLVANYERYRGDDELLLLTARFLGEAARRDESIRFYLEYLERKPQDAEAHYRLGAVYDENVQFEEAFTHFRKAHELQPGNNAYLGKLARTATTMGKYDEAIGYHAILAERTRDRNAIEQYYTLADGMNNLPESKKALRLLIENGGRLSASNYIYLAVIHREEGDLPGYLAVLTEAHRKYPQSPFVSLELANGHLFEKRPDLALQRLRGLDLAEFPQAAQSAVTALAALRKSRYAGLADDYLGHFGEALEKSKDLTPAELLEFGELCKEQRNSSRADRLFQRVLAEGSEAGHLARAHYHLGQFRSACSQQTAHLTHLNASRRATSGDYQFLGDIYGKLGDAARERDAYRHALALLRKETTKPPKR